MCRLDNFSILITLLIDVIEPNSSWSESIAAHFMQNFYQSLLWWQVKVETFWSTCYKSARPSSNMYDLMSTVFDREFALLSSIHFQFNENLNVKDLIESERFLLERCNNQEWILKIWFADIWRGFQHVFPISREVGLVTTPF